MGNVEVQSGQDMTFIQDTPQGALVSLREGGVNPMVFLVTESTVLGPQYKELVRFNPRVLTASKFCSDILGGAFGKVDVVPHAADEYSFKEVDSPVYTFFTAFDGNSLVVRKNPIGAIRAFKEAFGSDQSVRLLVRGLNVSDSVGRWLRQEALGSNIVFVKADVPISALWAQTNAFLSLHKSEGFGLWLLEALAQNKPVVATGWSGSEDFLNESNSLKVDYKMVSTENESFPGQWAEPDSASAVVQLRKCRETAWDRRPFESALGYRVEEIAKNFSAIL